MLTVLLTIAIMLTTPTPQLYAVEYDSNIYEYEAVYNSESEIGSATDDNFIITLDGKIVYVRDIVGGNVK